MVKTSVSIPRSDVATMPMSFKRRREITNVATHTTSFAATSETNFDSFGSSVFGNFLLQTSTRKQAVEANKTSKSVMEKGVAFNTTYPMAMDENALARPEAARIAQ